MSASSASTRAEFPFRALLWAALILGTGSLVYGLLSTPVLSTETWSATGLTRFARYTRVFAVTYVLIAVVLRRYLALCLGIPVVAMTFAGSGVVPCLAVLLLWMSSAVLGRWLFRTRDWMLAFLGGLCLWSLAMGFTAHAKIHYAAVYLIIQAAILVGRRGDTLDLLRSIVEAFRPRPVKSWGTLLGLGAFLYAFLSQWILVWKPEGSGDAMAMHLAIALDFANHHAYTFDFQKYIWALMPIGADLCYGAAAVVGGEYAARLLNLLMFGTVTYLVIRAAQRWLPTGAAWFLAALFAAAPLAQLVTGSMFVENFTAALSVGALYALWEYHESKSPRALCLCALLLGSNAGWKLSGLTMLAGMLPFVVGAARRNRVRFATAIAAAAIFLVAAAFPYAKAFAFAGNPVFPFKTDVFPSAVVKENLYDFRYQEPLTWHTLYDITFLTQRFYEGKDGSFAYHYLILLPLIAVALWKLREFEERSAVIAGFIAILCVAVMEPNARYFYPALPVVMVGGAAMLGFLSRLDMRLFAATLAVLAATFGLNIWFLPTSNYYHHDFYLRPLFSEQARVDYLRVVNPVREVVPFLNRTTGGVLFVQGSEIAGVRPPTFSDHWHNWTLRKLVEAARNGSHFYQTVVRPFDIQHFVAQAIPTAEDRFKSPAAYKFLDVCGEPEFKTQKFVVLRLAADCEARFAKLAAQSRVFPPGKYNDDDERIAVTGLWDPGRSGFPQAFGANVSFTQVKDAEMKIEITGSAFVYGFTRAFNRGRAQILVDGKPIAVLDQYGAQVEWQASKRYSLPKAGQHTITIRVLGEKSAESKGTFVDFDFFAVEP